MQNTLENHFPMIVSKLPCTVLHNSDMIVVCLFQKEGVNFIVINPHLNSKEFNIEIREKEVDMIVALIESLPEKYKNSSQKDKIKDALKNKNIFLFGDFNFHYPGENKSLDKHEIYDLWLEQHSHFDGLTWDHRENKLNKYKSILDNRRLRWWDL
jgi:endonuclease/exonuclease/phosphatase family metal-dependent hydrolase